MNDETREQLEWKREQRRLEDAMAEEIYKITLSGDNAMIRAVAVALIQSEVTPEQIEVWYGPSGWFYTNGWRTLDRQPLPADILASVEYARRNINFNNAEEMKRWRNE